ncbi:MAG: hypothetical protein GY710_21450 [Desulfobacteraceae bacterium]|nr:hypothetical protein [Desulfobacteraceae bacterium]
MMKKHFGIKDFIIGFLLATLLFILMGAAPRGSMVGRYMVTGDIDAYVVIDTMTGKLSSKKLGQELSLRNRESQVIDWAAWLGQ